MELERFKIDYLVRTGSDRLKLKSSRSLPVLTAFQRKRKNYSFEKFIFIAAIFLALSACEKNQETAENKITVSGTPKSAETVQAKLKESPADYSQKTPIDVAKLANKTAEEIDKILGRAEEIKTIESPKKGEYRVYKIADEPKGLAIRFYDNKAKNFNLILSVPVSTAKEALKKTFALDVGNQPPTKDAKEPLSEKWSGNFSGVKFSTVYAKRESEKSGFVFVLAQVAE